METLSNNIATKITSELNMDNDRKEVIAYGIFALLQAFISISFTIILGYIFNVTIEALIILFIASILRKYSGGAHASSPSNCTLIGLTICIGQAVVISLIVNMWGNPSIILVLVLMIFVLSYYLLYKLAPVGSLLKPINKTEKKKRMKKKSLIVLSGYFLITIVMMVLYLNFQKSTFLVYALCISGGIAWQVFTLTKCGHLTLNKIDAFLKNIV